ncbi:MAG: helicase, partial [Rhodobacteraceae bacterium]
MYKEHNVTFVLGPTNTGKTFYAIERMSTYESGMIGLPLRLLAREVYDKFILKKGRLSTALITGEEQIIPPRAKYFICTVEAMPTNKSVDFVAIDEIQLCNDYERGHIFTEKLLYTRGNIESLFLGSDTMEPIIKKIFPYGKIIKKNRRSKLTYIGKKSFFSLPKRSAIVAFRTKDVYNIAAQIKSQKGGAAVVLGALSPQTRNSQVDMFEAGEVDYIVATDAIGMGLNLNIENVSFAALEKYDGKKERYLKKNEIAQIAGRAGRNEKDGFFSNTFKTGFFSKELTQSIEQNLFDPINFLYWRNKNLDFNSIKSLLNSLNKKSDNPLLIKTLNTRDEYILKHLAVNTEIIKYLSNYDCIKILWEISKIPDYMKSIDYKYSDLLIKLFIDLIQNGKINSKWVMNEIIKLQNIKGSIEELTFKLSKTRFWNYVTNKSQWFENNSNLKEAAKEIENILSKALHEKLIKEFVDSKLKVIVKEITSDKDFEVIINNKKEIVLNKKIIGNIIGIEAKLYNQESYKKNKSVYNTIITKVSEAINKYIFMLLNDQKFTIKISDNLDIIYNKYKIASIYRGENIFSPKLIISNNKYITKDNYNLLKEKIHYHLVKVIKYSFKEQEIILEDKNQNLKAIIFSLQENLGVIKISEVSNFYKLLNSNDFHILKK